MLSCNRRAWHSLHEDHLGSIRFSSVQDVKMVAWHPKGEVLVSCSYDDSIKVWVDSDGEWECAQTLAGPGLGHSSTVWGIAFNKDGNQMVSCSDDQTLRVWACSFNNPGIAFSLSLSLLCPAFQHSSQDCMTLTATVVQFHCQKGS